MLTRKIENKLKNIRNSEMETGLHDTGGDMQ